LGHTFFTSEPDLRDNFYVEILSTRIHLSVELFRPGGVVPDFKERTAFNAKFLEILIPEFEKRDYVERVA